MSYYHTKAWNEPRQRIHDRPECIVVARFVGLDIEAMVKNTRPGYPKALYQIVCAACGKPLKPNEEQKTLDRIDK